MGIYKIELFQAIGDRDLSQFARYINGRKTKILCGKSCTHD